MGEHVNCEDDIGMQIGICLAVVAIAFLGGKLMIFMNKGLQMTIPSKLFCNKRDKISIDIKPPMRNKLFLPESHQGSASGGP